MAVLFSSILLLFGAKNFGPDDMIIAAWLRESVML